MNWWGFFTATGTVAALLWLLQNRHQLGVSQNEFWVSIWILFFGALIGAKALFLILGWQHYVLGELQFWADFDVGFIFFGGLLGGAAAGFIYAHMRGLSFIKGADYFAFAIPLGHAIGRIGCFVTGCCAGLPPHPVQLYESLGLGFIALTCRVILNRIESGQEQSGAAFRMYILLYCLLRIILDPLRADGRPERFFGMSHQQLIALAIIITVSVWHMHHNFRQANGRAYRASGGVGPR